MADILTMLQQFLCYGNSACIQEFQQYAQKPMEGIFYAVFFPIVFIIIFVYILSTALSLKSKGIKMLIAVAVFAFIIMQGWYQFFLILGRLWLYVIVFLGIFWGIVYTFRGKGGGNDKVQGRIGGLGGGALSGVLGRIGKDVKGDIRRCVRDITLAIEQVRVVEKAADAGDQGAWRMASDTLRMLHEYRQQLRELLKVNGVVVDPQGILKNNEKKIETAIKKLQRVQAKFSKSGE